MPRTRMNRAERKFGLELEFTTTNASTLHGQLANCAQNHQIPYVGRFNYGPSDGRAWELKTDSSCGFELSSPALMLERWSEVDQMATALVAAGTRITPECGVHVHHGVPDFRTNGMFRRLYVLWLALEPLAFAACAAARESNMYCGRMNSGMSESTFAQALAQSGGIRALRRWSRNRGRHVSLNFLTYWRQGTVEFRGLHGTLDLAELRWWVLFTQTIVELSTRRLHRSTMQELALTPAMDLAEAFSRLVRRNAWDEWTEEMLASLPVRTRRNPEALVRAQERNAAAAAAAGSTTNACGRYCTCAACAAAAYSSLWRRFHSSSHPPDSVAAAAMVRDFAALDPADPYGGTILDLANFTPTELAEASF